MDHRSLRCMGHYVVYCVCVRAMLARYCTGFLCCLFLPSHSCARSIDVFRVIAHSGLVLFSFSLPVLAFCSLGFGMIGLGAHAPPDCWSTYPAYPLAHSRAWLCYVLRCAALRCAALRGAAHAAPTSRVGSWSTAELI